MDADSVFQAQLTQIIETGSIEKATAEALASLVDHRESERSAAEQRILKLRDEALKRIDRKAEAALNASDDCKDMKGEHIEGNLGNAVDVKDASVGTEGSIVCLATEPVVNIEGIRLEYQQRIADLQNQVIELRNSNAALNESLEDEKNSNQELMEKVATINSNWRSKLDKLVEDTKGKLRELRANAAAKDEKINELSLQLQDKDMKMAVKDTTLKDWQQRLKFRGEELKGKNNRLAAMEVELTDKNTKLAEREKEVKEKDATLVVKNMEIAGKSNMLAEKERVVKERDEMLAERDTELNDKNALLAEKEKELQQSLALLESKSNLIEKHTIEGAYVTGDEQGPMDSSSLVKELTAERNAIRERFIGAETSWVMQRCAILANFKKGEKALKDIIAMKDETIQSLKKINDVLNGQLSSIKGSPSPTVVNSHPTPSSSSTAPVHPDRLRHVSGMHS